MLSQAMSPLRYRLHQLGLIVDRQLRLQVDDNQVGAPRTLVVQLALRIELRRRLDPDDVRAGRKPPPEKDRIAGVGGGDCNDGIAHAAPAS